MGTMEKIRKTSPMLMGFIAFMFIGFMVIADTDLGSIISQDSTGGNYVADVNGEKIPYAKFEELVRQQVESRREQLAAQNPNGADDIEVDEDPIRESVFNQLVDEVLLNQKAEELGITVTDEEVRDVLIENPPQFVRQQFSDKDGNFMRDPYLQVLTNPDAYFQNIWNSYPDSLRTFDPAREAARFKESMVKVEDFIRASRLEEKIRAIVNASLATPSLTLAKNTFESQSGETTVDLVSVDISSVADSSVKVSDSEIAEYYSARKNSYKQKNSRRVKYVIFPLVPSAKDTAKMQKRIKSLQDALAASATDQAKDSVFTLAMADGKATTNDYATPNSIAPNVLSAIAGQPKGAVIGPINDQNGSSFYRIDDVREGQNEVVRASHILIRIENNDTAAAKTKVNEALKRVRGGEDFQTVARELSQDPSAANNGGDLGYFGKGMMVPEFEKAAFAAAIGTITEPVLSQFGYHIIKVADKQSTEIKYSSLTFAPTISSGTRRELTIQANALRDSLIAGRSIDTVATKLKYAVQTSGFFEQASPFLGSRTLTNKIFNAKANDILEPMDIRAYGIVVTHVTDVRLAGIKPLDDVKEEIKTRLIREKKLDAIKAKAEEIYGKLNGKSSFAGANIPTASNINVREGVAVKNNGFVPGLGQDFTFTGAVSVLPKGKVSKPIRGEQAYYVVLVRDRMSPDKAAFDAQKKDLLKQAKDQVSNSVYFRWKQALKDNASIKDMRQ